MEEEAVMNWSEVMNEISDYVEQHLQRDMPEIDHDEISNIAKCSFSFFQKVFAYMNVLSFAEYIRFRKLTLAGYDLKSSRIRIIDLSYKYGYDSPTSFTKAFQKFHGFSPSEAWKDESKLRVFPRFSIDANAVYTWHLETKKELRLIGKSWTVSTKENQHYKQIPELWNNCQINGTYTLLVNCDRASIKGMFGLFGAIDSWNETIEYSIMVESSDPLPEGCSELFLPVNTWAIFNCYGKVPEAIHKGWQYLNNEWLVKYPFKHAQLPEIEWYGLGEKDSNDYLSQIWMPIIEEG